MYYLTSVTSVSGMTQRSDLGWFGAGRRASLVSSADCVSHQGIPWQVPDDVMETQDTLSRRLADVPT